ncbi:class I tRNA ligase family protein [Nocardia wallacei]|uniref:class I tRNA ligase family protein n=1 Tax=Nocardia wallacei TaxID=480035 RepID=UPI002455D93F|nr:class I tRNA ligase family protein [Nocardia wallacei]
MAEWLLIPMCPTPNGRLHIGHGAGPYLRADAIARALRRTGNTVAVITGTDAYENWVLAAVDDNSTPEQTCRHHHVRIKHDLDNLGVELDAWIDPLAEEHREAHRRLHEQLLHTLRDRGAAHLETEPVPVGTTTDRPLLGVWIAGNCPGCGAPAGGNTCTACGDHFHPDQLQQARSRLTDEPIRWEQRDSWFAYPADPPDILSALSATGLPDRFLTAPRRFLHRPGARIRLSQPSDWGLTSNTLPSGHVLANTYYGYALYAGLLHADGTGNALDRDSAVTVVGLFGSDNSIAGLVAPHVLATPAGYKPFDHTVVNHMLHVDSRKCSTSKQHGIWISDLIDNTSVTTDELRYSLAHEPLDHHIADLTPATLIARINELRHWRTARLATALHTFSENTTAAIDTARIAAVLDTQQHQLTPPHVDLAAATQTATTWMFTTPDLHLPETAATWLAGTALLTSPITPTLATELWTSLGFTGPPRQLTPTTERVSSHRIGNPSRHTPGLSRAEISPYLRIEGHSPPTGTR